MYLSAMRGINVLNPMSHGWHGNEWPTLVCWLAVCCSLYGLAICVCIHNFWLSVSKQLGEIWFTVTSWHKWCQRSTCMLMKSFRVLKSVLRSSTLTYHCQLCRKVVIVWGVAEHYCTFHTCIVSTINSKYYSKPYCYKLIQHSCDCHW